MPIVDGTHLPERLLAINAKKPEDLTALETATLDAYVKKYGSGGVDTVTLVVDMEADSPPSGKKSVKSDGWKI